MAESIAFSYGTNFFSPSNSGFNTSNGVTTILEWQLDTGMTLGVVNEQTVLDYTNAAGVQQVGDVTVNGIRITQSVMDRVRIGLGLGSGATNNMTADDRATVVDVVGEVTLFSGEGNRVKGSLVATVAARYMNTPNLVAVGDAVDNLNGSNVGLAVKLGF